MAVEIEDAQGIVVLNLFDPINQQVLRRADPALLRDKARYRQGRKFVRDRDKRQKAGLT